MNYLRKWGLVTLLSAVPMQMAAARQDDEKIERGVEATPPAPATKEAPPVPKASDKTYPIPMVALAAVGTVMVIAAVCIPMRKRVDDDD